jgi:hypothetical protein
VKEAELCSKVEIGGIDIDGRAFDVLHHDVGLTLGRVAGIEQAGDTRVAEGGENLPLSRATVPMPPSPSSRTSR